MSDKQEVIQQVEKFDKGKLKKSNTEEKNYIPTQQEIEEEKKAMKEGKCNWDASAMIPLLQPCPVTCSSSN